MTDTDHVTDLWLATYEQIAKTLRSLPDPITLPPLVLDEGMVDRITVAACEASAALYERAEGETGPLGPHRILADALLFWLAAFDGIGWLRAEIDYGQPWRLDATLVVLRQAVTQTVAAAQWLNDGPPTPPPADHTAN